MDDFWEDSEFARKHYVGEPVTDLMIASVEKELGYKLPRAYIELLRTQNGGAPKRTNHPAAPTSWAKDHVALTAIFGIDRAKRHSLCGGGGSRFYHEEWGYPDIGIYFADCPSAGHDMIALDYRKCGPQGEPEVVHVDQECDCKITFLARNFSEFLRGLRADEDYEDEEHL
jgi:hypothetical protein